MRKRGPRHPDTAAPRPLPTVAAAVGPRRAVRLTRKQQVLLVAWLLVTGGGLVAAGCSMEWWPSQPRLLWLLPQVLVLFFVVIVFLCAWLDDPRESLARARRSQASRALHKRHVGARR